MADLEPSVISALLERGGGHIACHACGKLFAPTGPTRPAYCSEDCKNPKISCEFCGRMFRPSQRGYQFLCSMKCRNESLSSPIGTRRIKDGYILIRVPKDTPGTQGDRSWMLEHRYVMQNYLDRSLKSSESVHHINGDKTDNDITNLELRIGNHGKGASSAHCPTCKCFD